MDLEEYDRTMPRKWTEQQQKEKYEELAELRPKPSYGACGERISLGYQRDRSMRLWRIGSSSPVATDSSTQKRRISPGASTCKLPRARSAARPPTRQFAGSSPMT